MQRRRGAPGRLGAAGETLVETVVSIALLAIVAVGVVGALGSEVIASARDRESATTESVVRSFAAWVDNHVGATTYPPCAGSANPFYGGGAGQWTSAGLGYAAPPGFTASVVGWGPNLSWVTGSGGVGYRPGDVASLSGDPQTTCPGADALLVLTLRVRTTNGTGTQSTDLLVRKP